MPARGSRSSSRTLLTGPWKGVRDTREPFDDSPNELVDAQNGYLPDPVGGSGFYARPGFDLQNGGAALAGAGQGIFTHATLDGTVYNFVCAGGHLYRADAALSVYTDVTPVSGVTIDATAPRVYFTTFADQLIISDGVSAPWIAATLSATPITGAYIDYDGMGVSWTAFGQPVVFGGSLFLILTQVNSVGRRTDISWSAPGDPTIGWQQPDFDYNWTLQQTGSTPLFALCATNVALFYFRERSIGAISGTPGPDLQQAATHDAISVNVGTMSCNTIRQYGETIFFCDSIGRPWKMSLGSPPDPIWLAMRSVIESSTSGYPSETAQVANATIDLSLNLYLAAIWSPVPGVANPPIECVVFDAKTGIYLGRWVVGPGIAIEMIGSLANDNGRSALVILGSKLISPNAGGYVWTQNNVLSAGIPLATEDDVLLLTEDGISITTETVVASWLDNGEVPAISVTTPRLGYSPDEVWNVSQATVITGIDTPVSVTVQTPSTPATVEGTPTPGVSFDGTYRLVCGTDLTGRGVQVIVAPTTADTQWVLFYVGIQAVASLAGPEDG